MPSLPSAIDRRRPRVLDRQRTRLGFNFGTRQDAMIENLQRMQRDQNHIANGLPINEIFERFSDRLNIFAFVKPDSLTPRERTIGKASNLRQYLTNPSSRLLGSAITERELKKWCERYMVTEEEIDAFDELYRAKY